MAFLSSDSYPGLESDEEEEWTGEAEGGKRPAKGKGKKSSGRLKRRKVEEEDEDAATVEETKAPSQQVRSCSFHKLFSLERLA